MNILKAQFLADQYLTELFLVIDHLTHTGSGTYTVRSLFLVLQLKKKSIFYTIFILLNDTSNSANITKSLTSRPVVGNGGSGLSQISILVLRSDSEQVVLFRCEVRDGVLSHGQSLDQGSPVLEWGLLNLYLVGQGDVQVIVRGNKDSAPAQASLVRFLLPDLRSSNRYTWANYKKARRI